MGLSNTLIDNSENLKLIDTINEIIAEPKINEICIATGYWDLKGTALITDTLLQFLEKNDAKVRILIGKDPIVFARDLKNDVYKNAKEYPKDFLKIDLANIDMNDEQCQKAAKMLIDYCSDENKKIEVKIFETNENDEKQFLHSKCYIFYGSGVAYGIIGSSNFTQKGLEGNSELNYLETLTQMITAKPDGINMAKGHIFWFNEKWKLAKDWTQEFIVQLQNSPIGKKVVQKKKAENKPLTAYDRVRGQLQSEELGTISFVPSQASEAIPVDLSHIPGYFPGGTVAGTDVSFYYYGERLDNTTLAGVSVLFAVGEDPANVRPDKLTSHVTGTVVGHTADTVTIRTADNARLTVRSKNASTYETGSEATLTINPALTGQSGIYE